MLGYARFRAAYEVGFYPLYEKPPGSLVDFYYFQSFFYKAYIFFILIS